MYNGVAYVSTNSVRVPVYAFDDDCINLTNNRIGWIYPKVISFFYVCITTDG